MAGVNRVDSFKALKLNILCVKNYLKNVKFCAVFVTEAWISWAGPGLVRAKKLMVFNKSRAYDFMKRPSGTLMILYEVSTYKN
ncbi:hypothetical protein BWI97_00975 [Siphonobacter sp. BAB-5405]|nr:hypothetical protein BWI97_00975 [Siphonobacter sp. BAB-5405]